MTMLAVVVASICIMLMAFALLGLRSLVLKNGTFRGTCAGNSVFLRKEGVVCGVCGRQPGEECGKDPEKVVTSKIH
jgi:hypothetical protein